jgi:30S ribosomal protein S31
MGRGDKRTKKGKIFAGSYGNTRPKTKPKAGQPAAQAEEKPAKKGKS